MEIEEISIPLTQFGSFITATYFNRDGGGDISNSLLLTFSLLMTLQLGENSISCFLGRLNQN